MSMLAEQIAGMRVSTNKHMQLAPYMVRPFWWMDETTRVAVNVRWAIRWGWEPESYVIDTSKLPVFGIGSGKMLITSPEGLEILKIKIAEQEQGNGRS